MQLPGEDRQWRERGQGQLLERRGQAAQGLLVGGDVSSGDTADADSLEGSGGDHPDPLLEAGPQLLPGLGCRSPLLGAVLDRPREGLDDQAELLVVDLQLVAQLGGRDALLLAGSVG